MGFVSSYLDQYHHRFRRRSWWRFVYQRQRAGGKISCQVLRRFVFSRIRSCEWTGFARSSRWSNSLSWKTSRWGRRRLGSPSCRCRWPRRGRRIARRTVLCSLAAEGFGIRWGMTSHWSSALDDGWRSKAVHCLIVQKKSNSTLSSFKDCSLASRYVQDSPTGLPLGEREGERVRWRRTIRFVTALAVWGIVRIYRMLVFESTLVLGLAGVTHLEEGERYIYCRSSFFYLLIADK